MAVFFACVYNVHTMSYAIQFLCYHIPHVGNLIHRVDPSSVVPVSVEVFAFTDTATHSAVVVLVDQNQGASITNCCDELLPRIYQDVLAICQSRDIRWLYRDTLGDWCRLHVPPPQYAKDSYDVSFGPTAMRTAGDVIADLGSHGSWRADFCVALDASIARAVANGAGEARAFSRGIDLRAVTAGAVSEFDF